jgi:hypothetical protein
MKSVFLFFFLLIAGASFAQTQMHFMIPVQELDTVVAAHDSSAFRMHPVQLDIDVDLKEFGTDVTPDIYTLTVTTTYYEKWSNLPFYKAKNSTTVSILEVPSTAINLKSTLYGDKSYNLSKLNPILAMFGLMYRSIPVKLNQ